jgi:hypothetical protein
MVGSSDWGRLWAAALAACGTLLTTFAVALTNHLPAAAAAAASLWLLLAIRSGTHRSAWPFFAAGLAAALTAAFELPALAWLVAVIIGLAKYDLRRTITAAVPAALLVAASAAGHRQGRTLAGGLCVARDRRPSRHPVAHSGLAARGARARAARRAAPPPRRR